MYIFFFPIKFLKLFFLINFITNVLLYKYDTNQLHIQLGMSNRFQAPSAIYECIFFFNSTIFITFFANYKSTILQMMRQLLQISRCLFMFSFSSIIPYFLKFFHTCPAFEYRRFGVLQNIFL